MIVNAGEQLANDFEARMWPIGTQLIFSHLMVSDAQGAQHIMAPGVLVGYDRLGHVDHVLVQRSDEQGLLQEGVPKVIATSTLRKFVEIIEIAPGSEKMPEPYLL